MLKSNFGILLFLLFSVNFSFSQSIEILGKVVSKTDVENIHVINKSAQTFTITNKDGMFRIIAKTGDTLQFSSIQQGIKTILVSKEVMVSRTILVQLDEQINQLDEVVVGKVLSGDLNSDIKNVEGKVPINFYDVGIPGYTGKIATQSQRRLSEAGEFKPQMLLGLLGGGLPLNPILNGISGRTKMLKKRVEIENRQNLIRKIKSNLSEVFFSNYELDKDLRADFFFFCEEDTNFMNRCKGKSDLEVFEFLKEKLEHYKQNLQSNKD